ncbi:MAG: F0F1 ATP synthase subunit A [Bryobacteraceae bacterium]
MEHEPWLTALFNDYLPGAGNALIGIVGDHAVNPLRPWSTPVVMELLVAFLIVVVFAMLRAGLSMDRPGSLQHIFELVYHFLKEQADENIGHGAGKYLPFFGTLFLFILFANLLGIVPTFESPTMFPEVPFGLAILAFAYYNWAGMASQGVGKYLAHFAGPMPILAPLMVPIEIISNLARPLSLTVRLFANMYAGEQVTLVFISMVPLVVPVVFMVLHLFVGVLQAYVFTLLTMIYVAGAVVHDEH